MKEILYKLNQTKDKIALRIFENGSNVFEDLKKLNVFFNFLTNLINNISRVVLYSKNKNMLVNGNRELKIIFTPILKSKY